MKEFEALKESVKKKKTEMLEELRKKAQQIMQE